jgi:hypothetical protein
MGRKSRMKRERRRAREQAVTPDEVFEPFPGVLVRRKGRFSEIAVRRTPEEHRALVEHIRSTRPKLIAELDETVARLRSLMTRLPIQEFLSNLAMRIMAHDPETYKETDGRESMVLLEYATWLYVIGNQCSLTAIDMRGFELFNQVRELLQASIEQVQLVWATQHVEAGRDSPTALDHIIFRTRCENLNVRASDYRPHLAETLRSLFDGFSIKLDSGETVPSVEEILWCHRAASKLVNDRLNSLLHEQIALVEKADAVLTGRSAGADAQEEARFLAELAQKHSEDRKEAREFMSRICSSWSAFRAADVFRISITDLAMVSGCSAATARAFLELFAIEPGEDSGSNLRPNRIDAISEQPLLRVGSDTFLAHLLVLIPWAIRPRLEGLLRMEQRLWKAYEKRRSRYLEDECTKLLASVNGSSRAFSRLAYSFAEGGGPAEQFELDGLVLLDRALFIVEAKSGNMRQAGRRGAPSVLEDLEALVAHPHEQALRALRYVNSAESVMFRLEDPSQVIEIRAGDFSRIFLVTPTLDHLEAFATHLSNLKELGMLGQGTLPWSVYLNDLRIIVDCVEGAGQLVHYLTRRARVEELSVEAHDELDWFGHYLFEGLYFEEIARTACLTLGSFTTIFDDYYLYVEGVRQTITKKPRQEMPDVMRELIATLERATPAGFVLAICALLDGNVSARKEFANCVLDRRAQAIRHGFSAQRMTFEHTVVAYIASGGVSQQMCDEYTAAAKYRAQTRGAVGIMQSIDNPDSCVVSHFEFDWQEDAELERLSNRVFSSLASRSKRLR